MSYYYNPYSCVYVKMKDGTDFFYISTFDEIIDATLMTRYNKYHNRGYFAYCYNKGLIEEYLILTATTYPIHLEKKNIKADAMIIHSGETYKLGISLEESLKDEE